MGTKQAGGRPRKTNGKMKEVVLKDGRESITRQQSARNKKTVVQATQFRLTTLTNGRRGVQRKHHETVLEDNIVTPATSDRDALAGTPPEEKTMEDDQPTHVHLRAKSRHKLAAVCNSGYLCWSFNIDSHIVRIHSGSHPRMAIIPFIISGRNY